MIPDLDRITALATLLGDPQLTYPSIHVTGTNGKTTTSRLIASLACAHGIPVGLYTSPHLISVRERIAECATAISEDGFAEQYEHLLPYLKEVDSQGDRVTYFETLTALAYLWFSDIPVSLGVFEVGMGGEWDATNLVSGDVAVVCPISLDHPELGPSIADKAKEKAAIIKSGKIAIVREQPDEALAILEARAVDVGAKLLLEDRDFGVVDRFVAVGGQFMTIRGLHNVYDQVFLPLFGEHAAVNAAAAVVAVEAFLGRALVNDELRSTLAEATSPGRLEIVGRHPLVILDGAHNPAGAQALAQALEESFTWNELHLVVAISANKDVPGILDPLIPLVTRVHTTSYEGARAASADALAEACAAAGIRSEAFASIADALAAAAATASATDVILVTGSLFAVGEARALLADPA